MWSHKAMLAWTVAHIRSRPILLLSVRTIASLGWSEAILRWKSYPWKMIFGGRAAVLALIALTSERTLEGSLRCFG